MTFEQLEEYRRTHHYIPPEKLLAAYEGLHVSKINPAMVARMSLQNLPHLILDKKLRLCGVYYLGGYWKQGYIQISHDEYGEYLYKPDYDTDGNPILPDGWAFNKKGEGEPYASVFSGSYEGEAMSSPFSVSEGAAATPAPATSGREMPERTSFFAGIT